MSRLFLRKRYWEIHRLIYLDCAVLSPFLERWFVEGECHGCHGSYTLHPVYEISFAMLYLKIEASGNSTGLSWPPQYYQTCLIFTIQNLDDCIRSFWADCYKQSSPLSSQRSCWCCQATVIILGLGANISSHAIVDRNLKSHLQFSQQNSKPGLPTHPDAFNLLLFSSSFFFFSQQRVTTRSCCTMPVIILFISASPWDHMTGITTDSLLNS